MQTLTALDSNMTFTSPSTTGPFCRLMTAALLPTSGNTWKTAQRCVHHLLTKESVWPDTCMCDTHCAVLLFGTHTLEHQLFLHNYLHLEIAAITFTHTWEHDKADIQTGTHKGMNQRALLVWRVLPAMEWMRMLLILRLLGGGSCLLNLLFMIS